MKRFLNQSGFTLTEIMVVVAITSLLMMVFMGFATNSLVNTSIESARSDLLREAQQALDTISQDIRLSSNADDLNRHPDDYNPNAASTPYGWVSDDTTLILATAAMDSSRNIIFEDPLHYSSLKNNKIYYVQDGTLYRRTLAADHVDNNARTSCPASATTPDCPADSVLINDTVQQFSIRYLNADDSEVAIPTEARSVELSIRLETTKFGRTLDTSYVTRTVFRNE